MLIFIFGNYPLILVFISGHSYMSISAAFLAILTSSFIYCDEIVVFTPGFCFLLFYHLPFYYKIVADYNLWTSIVSLKPRHAVIKQERKRNASLLVSNLSLLYLFSTFAYFNSILTVSCLP